MPQFVQEFEYYGDVTPADDCGGGPFGQRMVVNVLGGEFTGDRLKGTFVGAGADWLLFGADGFARLDVRATIRTHDGAHIYMQYYGLLEATPAVAAAFGGGGDPTEYGDQYFFTHPRLETGDPRYAWVNTTFLVGQGRLIPGGDRLRVEYRTYRVTN